MTADKKQTIAFMLPTLAAGGAERVLVNLLKEFNRARFDLQANIIVGQATWILLGDSFKYHTILRIVFRHPPCHLPCLFYLMASYKT